jgi:hypothetical protein
MSMVTFVENGSVAQLHQKDLVAPSIQKKWLRGATE